MISVVLPTYREAESIVSLVHQVIEELTGWGESFEILVVDDASPDGTADLVEEAFGAIRAVRVLRRIGPRSLGLSVRDGLECCTGEKVVVMDSDFNHDPRVVPYLVKYLEDFDLVIGSRFAPGGEMPSRLRHFGSFGINLLLRVILRTQVQDNLSGFFAIRRESLDRLPFDRIFWGYGDYFFRLVVFALRLPLRILEVPVVYGARRAGTSKTPLLLTTCRYLSEIVRLRAQLARDPSLETRPRLFYAERPEPRVPGSETGSWTKRSASGGGL